MTDFDEIRRFAIDSQMTLVYAERVTSVLISPVLFLNACAFLVETADRFEMMYRHEEVAVNELFLRMCADGNESLPTIWRCYNSFLVKGELIDLGPRYWRRRDVAYLRTMLQRFREQKLTGLGLTLDDRPLKICGVFTDRQRLDAMCPAANAAPVENALRTPLRTGVFNPDHWWEHEVIRRDHLKDLPYPKDYLNYAKILMHEFYGAVPPDSELYRIKVVLYRGDTERPKNTKKR